jgi:hypothetical protein
MWVPCARIQCFGHVCANLEEKKTVDFGVSRKMSHTITEDYTLLLSFAHAYSVWFHKVAVSQDMGTIAIVLIKLVCVIASHKG